MKTMKANIVLFIAILSFLFSRCSDKGALIDPELSKIAGAWIWIKSTGGVGPRLITPDSGFTSIDTYSIDGSFHRYQNDTLVVSARFSLAEDNSVILLGFTNLTTYFEYSSASFREPVQATIEADTLILGAFCCDMFQDWYTRVKQ